MNRLGHRDLQILDHIRRHRLSTRAFLRRLFFAGAKPNAVGKVAARLAAGDWIREHTMGAGFTYCVLGRRGARLLGAGPKCVRPFTEQTFPHAYGLLAYCVSQGLRRFTPDEFRTEFPELCRPQVATAGYFLEPTGYGALRLATALLDRGNSPRLILRKLERIISHRYHVPAFFDLIQKRNFSVTILTAWPSKQKYLLAAVQQTVRGPTRVTVATVPELQPFIPRM